MKALLFALAVLTAGAAAAQEVVSAPGVVLRALDRVSGDVEDIEVDAGGQAQFHDLLVTVSDCRYPAGDRSANAYAHLTISHQGSETPAFDGWMIASSPALSALDDPRYDVWVLRCKSE